MSRVKKGVTKHARHKKIIKLAKGYRGRAKNCFRVAVQYVERALQYNYRDRKQKKRDMRSLWIQRINAAARLNGIKGYSKFIKGLNKCEEITLNRKSLSEIAIKQPSIFTEIANKVKKHLLEGELLNSYYPIKNTLEENKN